MKCQDVLQYILSDGSEKNWYILYDTYIHYTYAHIYIHVHTHTHKEQAKSMSMQEVQQIWHNVNKLMPGDS